MKKLSFKLAAMLFVLVQMSVVANAAAKDVYEQLMVAAQADKTFDDFPSSIKQGFAQAVQASAEMTPEKLTLINQSIDKHINPSDIYGTIGQLLKQNLNEKQAEKLLKWYTSEVGKEITAAEQKANSQEAMMAMQQQAQQLFADEFRVGFAQRMDEVMGITDAVMGMQVGMSMAIATGMTTMMQPEKMPDMAALRTQIESNMAPMRGNMQSMIILMAVYSYQDISEDKLKQYEGFVNTPEAKVFADTLMKGMAQGIEKELFNWSGELAKIVVTK